MSAAVVVSNVATRSSADARSAIKPPRAFWAGARSAFNHSDPTGDEKRRHDNRPDDGRSPERPTGGTAAGTKREPNHQRKP